MNKQQIGATAYQYFLIIIILAAIAYRGGRDFLFNKNKEEVTVTIENIQEIYPTAAYYDQNRPGAYDVYANNSNKIGTVFLSSDYSQQFGYAGNVPLLIGVDDNLTITKITLLPNNETEYYIEALYGKKFIGKWQGVNLDDAVQFHVDAISGATHTSKAVIAGIRQTASSVVGSGASVATGINHWTMIKDILLLSLILLSLVMVYKKGSAKYRTIYMFLVLIIMGLILNNALSVKLLNGWLLDGFSWRSNWQTGVIFILALSVS
ncbi:MAG TPA: FMN-binding protein, partial [Bacteroidales bacterium]|nr:FMN-binding protein [Bacteroidales bacterium]